MFYSYELSEIPQVENYYTVTRNTIWEIAENEHILIFIRKGMCEIIFDGESFILNEGNVFFIPKKHRYLRKPIDNTLCTMTYIHFSASNEFILEDAKQIIDFVNIKKQELDTEILSGEPNLSYFNTIYLCNLNNLTKHEKVFELLKNINQFSANRQLTCNMQSSITLCNILIYLSQNTLDTLLTDTNLKSSATIPPKLRKAISYIMRHYSEHISLDELADFCNISKQQLIRYFKHAFNTTPVNYITDYKLSRAKDMLFYHPNLSIKEIAAELGFDNQHYFSRVFTKKNKETPSQYRYRTTNYPSNDNS